MRRLVDTNILVYSILTDPKDRMKSTRARDILTTGDLAFSVQVLQEFYVQAIQPRRAGHLSHEQATEQIGYLCRYPVQAITLAILQAALATKQRFQISYWDAAIIEAARALNCSEVLTEDLSHGQDYGGVRVVNPFQPA